MRRIVWHRTTLIIHYSVRSVQAGSSPLLLRSAPDTARILCRSFTPKRHRQLQVKDLPKVPTWRLERDSNPRPSDWKVSTQPMRHHVPRHLVSSSISWRLPLLLFHVMLPCGILQLIVLNELIQYLGLHYSVVYMGRGTDVLGFVSATAVP